MNFLDFWKKLFKEEKKKPKRRKTRKTSKPAKKKVKKVIKKKSPQKTAKKTAKRIKAKPKKKVQKKKTTKKAKPSKSKKPAKKVTKEAKEKEIGIITHYFSKISVAIIKLKSGLKIGDKIHIKGANDDFKQVIRSMQINKKDIKGAKKGDEIGIKVSKPAHENGKVFKVR